ncbi:MAG: hypothetical protein GF308_02610 [Candidatus Heimdallarchaeota archaeon]|nr:hypothetical protein [Candidatus Heimdallarchaeota archaeon]
MPKKRYTPLQTFILGVLNTFNKPMSGYDLITTAKQWRFDHYIKAASPASFYYTIEKLTKKGFIKEVGSKQKGNRPEQTIFQLLPKGREAFIEHMTHFLTELQHFYFENDATTPFILLFGFLEGKEVLLNALKVQIQEREKIFTHIREGRKYIDSYPLSDLNPFLTLALHHYKLHNQAEIDWLKDFYQMVEETDFKKNIQELSKRMAKQAKK